MIEIRKIAFIGGGNMAAALIGGLWLYGPGVARALEGLGVPVCSLRRQAFHAIRAQQEFGKSLWHFRK